MSANAKKDWLEALREMRDAAESVDEKEREKALAAFWATYPPAARPLDRPQIRPYVVRGDA
jgi:hypothetical protein